MIINSELTLYYQGSHYSWQELCQQISELSETLYSQERASVKTSHLVPVSAQKRFLSTLCLLQGFNTQWSVFPLSNEYSEAEKNIFLKQVQAHCLKDISLLIATSGSQAEPKIALLSQNNILSHCRSFARTIPLDSNMLWLNCMPMHHIAGVMIVYRCWFNNAAMLLHDDFDAKQIWTDLHRFPVTHISLVPRMLSRLLEVQLDFQLETGQDASLPKYLAYVIVGGDRLSESLYQRAVSAGWPIFISYGMTEATSTIAIGRTPDSLRLLDDFDAQVSPQGILKLKGPMVISTYAGSEKYSENLCFENKSFKNDWFETNDRVELHDQYLKITGRTDHMIVSGGKNIAPETIEALLSSAPDIDDIAIGKCKHPDYSEQWGDTIVALVCGGDMNKLKRWISEHIKPCYQPTIFIEVENIPRNSLGKVNRKALQQQLEKALNIDK